MFGDFEISLQKVQGFLHIFQNIGELCCLCKIYAKQAEAEVVPSSSLVEVEVWVEIEIEVGVGVEVKVGV